MSKRGFVPVILIAVLALVITVGGVGALNLRCPFTSRF